MLIHEFLSAAYSVGRAPPRQAGSVVDPSFSWQAKFSVWVDMSRRPGVWMQCEDGCDVQVDVVTYQRASPDEYSCVASTVICCGR